MNHITDVANLITIRNFLVNSVDNLGIKLSREDIKGVQMRITYLDKTIITNALKLDLTKVGEEPRKVIKSWESTDPVEDVASAVCSIPEKQVDNPPTTGV